MKISITGRHIDLTKSIKSYVVKKFSKLDGYFDFKDNGELHVIIEVQKYRHIAEANLYSKDHKFTARVETKDMYSSFDGLEEKLLKQIKKHKDKVTKHDKSRGGKRINILANISSVSTMKGEKYNEIVEEELQALKPMNTEEAIEELGISDDGFMLFFNADFNKVCLLRKRKDGKYGLTISKY